MALHSLGVISLDLPVINNSYGGDMGGCSNWGVFVFFEKGGS